MIQRINCSVRSKAVKHHFRGFNERIEGALNTFDLVMLSVIGLLILSIAAVILRGGQFHVDQPRLLYLAPADSPIKNLFLLNPYVTETPHQLTSSQTGIVSYAASPNGKSIVYSERQPTTVTNYVLRACLCSSWYVSRLPRPIHALLPSTALT